MIICSLGLHDWSKEWLPVYDEEGHITGIWYKECNEPGCMKIKAVFNFDEKPNKK